MTEEDLKSLETTLAHGTPGEMLEQVDYGRVTIIRDNQSPDEECCRTIAEFPPHSNETDDQFYRRCADAMAFVLSRKSIPEMIATIRAERHRADVAEARAEYWRAESDVRQSADRWARVAPISDYRLLYQEQHRDALLRRTRAEDRIRTLGVEL